MKNFTISRIDTDLGIFRVSGLWCNKKIAPLPLDITLIEVMSTDGWHLLNRSTDEVIILLENLTPILLVHLKSQQV
ncbi:hypothetical protein EKO29_12410 [Colwellia sp. Arc7-635]|uniref:hypothetical protein n=1 Tax=Colwellia sp. Arc7-635 TaxID=2497879 RepID=UPI000F85A44B|nr:hypothetical protein [Colwellia sp. Arc7-635]AZQ84729.1 hypothetical protein EKO29_12410 [Colwellia sp. Arc7-635]